MKIYLDDRYLKIVKDAFVQANIVGEIYGFGSRVRGDHREYSDLDLVIKSNEPNGLKKIGALKTLLEESNLPVTVDVVEWEQISKEFKKRIEPELVLIETGA